MSNCPICPSCATEMDIDVMRTNSTLWVCPDCKKKVMIRKVRTNRWINGDCWE